MKANKDGFHFSAFCLGIGCMILLLQAGGALHGNRIVFPDVREIGASFVRLLGQESTYASIGITLLHLLEALAASMAAGILLGLAEGLSSRFRSGLIPFTVLLRSLPMIVLVVLLMTVSSYDHVPVLAASLVLVPLISESVYEGVRSIDPELKDVYRMNSSFSATVFFQVYLPLISGFLKQAFFNAAGMGLKVVVSAEYLVQTRNSLGKEVYTSSYFLEYAEIYAYALIMILLVLLVTEVPVRPLKRAGTRY